ncbi:hypothetical protein [Meiothermus hypogaeus]|uniref:Uncharacterized protein n=2 Tax=Meiothermus hypogaeus TaxID=884155 RepID=A0A511R293_9DEIN|nr:hypothetical protein [Meiothermus hypogaeus]RIH80897.1 hypothetical protein Mhypo_00189 [Meiothermus hypogaeus]GEM82972.1 hypothetical protein MHY01S_11380 [Meiothermus hypogaeus NBRC 106114]GIW37098.1 MAG: hypothetical protein KatS3mg073_1243 [Meiothermus sp.]
MTTVLLLMLAAAAVLLMVQFGLDTQNLPQKPADVLTDESYVLVALLAMVVIAGLATAVLLYVAPQ